MLGSMTISIDFQIQAGDQQIDGDGTWSFGLLMKQA